jgi:hypothetical protein
MLLSSLLSSLLRIGGIDDWIDLDKMSERTSLLDKPTTPLPKLQLFLLFFIRMTDPVAFNCIFPFVQQMLLDIGAVQDPEKVGYYAGVVSSP